MNEHAEQNGHVDAILRELALGLIPEDEAEDAWAHVAECNDCTENLRLARSVYETALEDGRAHVAAEKLVAHSEQGTPLSRMESEHLGRCSDCRSDLEVLRDAPGIEAVPFGADTREASASRTESDERRNDARDGESSERPGDEEVNDPERTGARSDTERSHGPREWLRGWSPGGALAIATAAIAFILFLPRNQVDTSGLVPVLPIEVRVPRSAPDPETFEGAWIEALGEYADANYGAAEQGLRRALSLDPTHAESWLLLGSSQLLQDRGDDALAAFRSAEEFANHERILAEAEWQRIVARLTQGSVTKTELSELRIRIEAIAVGSSPHADDAQELIARLGSR